ncbi:MAG TPA: 3-hydroxyacyl-CoA dehydrogenase family protein, partial [Castellaniella sp.]|nr:3-hydroxyacyl-CoA dehydrogenase family protein [Castellaniella sp.]
VTAIGAALKHPGRLAGMHFFNPAPRMKLVEIVSGLVTTPATAQTLFDTATAWGKTAVHTRSTPGFIVNRVARPYYAEGLRLLLEQAGDPATLDHIMRDCGGFRMGPFELMDLIGHDINRAVTHSVWNAFYQDPRFQPSLVQQELVDAGRLGRKTGQGFFDYQDGAPAPEPRLEAPRPTPAVLIVHGDSPAANALADRLAAHGVAHQRASEAPDHRLASTGQAVVYLTDGRTAAHRAQAEDQANTVLLDLALDYTRSSCVAIAVAAQCAAEAADEAIGALQAAGFAVARIGDVPGMLVMRTVAMLANEAADAVNQGVCAPSAVDQAMCLGVNYPLGPLEWADRLGASTIGQVLGHIAAAYGEDRYRLSPLIQQAIHSARPLHD